MNSPSTQWREMIEPDEEARFARQVEILSSIHAVKSAQYGKGRLLHRKPVLALRGTLDVLADVPDYARHGVFAQARSYPVVVRFSNGGMDVEANAKPDIRGIAVKVLDVTGPSSLGGTADHQDFLLINHDRFSSRKSDEFVDAVAALAKGKGAFLVHMIRKYGFGGGLARVKLATRMLGKPFLGFANEPFNTVLPIAIGTYAARVRITPVAPVPPVKKDFAQDLRDRVAAAPLVYDVALQFFVDESITPIEDASVVWPENESPFVDVARLTLTTIDPDVEALRFDPWGGLAEHRPLGELMRARKSAYYASQKARRA